MDKAIDRTTDEIKWKDHELGNKVIEIWKGKETLKKRKNNGL